VSRWLRWLLSFLPRTAPPGPRLAIVRHHRVYAEGQQPLYRLGVGVATLERQLDLLGALGFTPTVTTSRSQFPRSSGAARAPRSISPPA